MGRRRTWRRGAAAPGRLGRPAGGTRAAPRPARPQSLTGTRRPERLGPSRRPGAVARAQPPRPPPAPGRPPRQRRTPHQKSRGCTRPGSRGGERQRGSGSAGQAGKNALSSRGGFGNEMVGVVSSVPSVGSAWQVAAQAAGVPHSGSLTCSVAAAPHRAPLEPAAPAARGRPRWGPCLVARLPRTPEMQAQPPSSCQAAPQRRATAAALYTPRHAARC